MSTKTEGDRVTRINERKGETTDEKGLGRGEEGEGVWVKEKSL